MALTLTTLNGAVVVDQNTITVVSATGFVAGAIIQIDQETMQVTKGYPIANQPVTVIPVLRGQDGTQTQIHVTGAQVKVGLSTDFVVPPAPQMPTSTPIGGPARVRISYSAAGAITLPSPGNDAVAVLNGTVALAMTLANPTIDMDGCLLYIVGNGKAAHTVTYAAGLGNNTTAGNADVITWFATAAQGLQLIACGGFWCTTGAVAGAGTLAGVGIA